MATKTSIPAGNSYSIISENNTTHWLIHPFSDRNKIDCENTENTRWNLGWLTLKKR